MPDARSRAQLVRLRKAPRRDDGTARVTIACPGTNRPLANMKKNPVSVRVAQTGSGPAFVIARMNGGGGQHHVHENAVTAVAVRELAHPRRRDDAHHAADEVEPGTDIFPAGPRRPRDVGKAAG